MGLDTLKDFLAVIGGVSLILGPVLGAWLTIRVHKSIWSAPAFIKLDARVKATEQWQTDHAEDVKMIPRLAIILDNVDEALRELKKVVEQLRT